MFDIEYKGGNTVVIATKKAKLVTDPKQSLVGLKDIDPKGMVCLSTEARFEVKSPEAILHIESPGDFEVSDFAVKGIPAQRHLDSEGLNGTMYRVEVGDVRIAIIGNIDPKLSEDQLEEIGVVDIVVIPIGGNGYTLDATSAAHLVRQIDAKVVIPVHYADSGLKYEVQQDDFELFHKELGGEVESVDKLKVKTAGTLPTVLTLYKLARS